MELGIFFMPVHRPEKSWSQALAEDREAIILADELGYSEAWMGEHFSTKVEQVPAPLMFLASLIHQTSQIRLGTGVVNLGHRHPIVVAAEAAQFDHLSQGRLMLGVGPGGLMSDGELFGRPDMVERVKAAAESINMVQALWSADAPFDLSGDYWQASLQQQIWPSHGVGAMCRPFQSPHPPIMMAMVSPGGRTAETIAERDFIPMSANFVPLSAVHAQWLSYAAHREALGRPTDRKIWRVCRNIVITESTQHAEDMCNDPDGVFAFYFRYLRGLRHMQEIGDLDNPSIAELNDMLDVPSTISECVIAGTRDEVLDRLVSMADYLGGFGTLVAVGHDFDERGTWQQSMTALARDVAPRLTQHMATISS